MTAYAFSQILPDSTLPPKYSAGMLYAIDFEYTQTIAFVAADTITTPADAMPDNGIRIVDAQWVQTKETDAHATPTGTWDIGDSGDADRFIAAVPMGINGVTTTGTQLVNWINRPQGLTAGVVSTGSGYLYAAGTSPRFIATVGGTVATGSTDATVRLRVWFYCTGEQ